MMRVVLAVITMGALLGAALPVVEDGRRTHADGQARATATTVAERAERLAATNDAGPRSGARSRLRVHLPHESWGNAGIRSMTVAGARDVVRWQVRGGRSGKLRVTGVDIRTPNGPISLGPGVTRLVLSLVGSPADPAVRLDRLEAVTDGINGSGGWGPGR